MKKNYSVYKYLVSFFVFILMALPLYLLLKNFMEIDLNHPFNYALFDIVSGIIILTIILIIYRKNLIDNFKKLKNIKFKDIMTAIFVGYIICIGFNLVFSGISDFLANIFNITKETAENQSIIESLLKAAPIFMIASACIVAPLTEEILFRLGLRTVFKNKKVFITVSGLIFGLMHITSNIVFLLEIFIIGYIIDNIISSNRKDKKQLLVICIISTLIMFGILYYLQLGNLITVIKSLNKSEILSGFSYVGMGFGLAYSYSRHDNIWLNIFTHALINTISVVAVLLLP